MAETWGTHRYSSTFLGKTVLHSFCILTTEHDDLKLDSKCTYCGQNSKKETYVFFLVSLVLSMFSLKKNQSLIDKPSKGNYPKKWVKWTLDEFPQHFPPRFTTAQQPRRKVCQRNPSVDGLGASGAPENAVKQWLGIDYPLVQDGLIWFNIV